MTHHNHHNYTHDQATSTILTWASHPANMPPPLDEETADVDEPPDQSRLPSLPSKTDFQRTTIPKSKDCQLSLLTKALHSQSEDDAPDAHPPSLASCGRRRSMTSNISLASTADLTSDTGFTSPARTNTPSPPLPEFGLLRLSGAERLSAGKTPLAPPVIKVQSPTVEAPPPCRKRLISFACGAAKTGVKSPIEQPVPVRPAPANKAPSATDAPRKTCIRFACPAPRPASTQNTPPQRLDAIAARLEGPSSETGGSPSPIARKLRTSSHSRSPRSPLQRRSPVPSKTKKLITANDKVLLGEGCRFHEFASDGPREDDWVRQDEGTAQRCKLTINDTLQKENVIRKLAVEAEEEAEQEEEDAETAIDEDEAADEDDEEEDEDADDAEEEEEDDLDGDVTEPGSEGDDNSDGYHTDEETGFADSDDENEEDGLRLWTPGRPALRLSGATPIMRRPSVHEQHSDSSIASRSSIRAVRRGRTQRIKIRPGTPDLPDSTDFVCGTLDEDRPMEDAYISCMAARKREKTHLIPQDIDPSFPASEPEDEDDEERYNPVRHSSDEDLWLHGEMEDLQDDLERSRRRRKNKGNGNPSPKRLRSPPPKPKPRGRSPAPPRRLFDGHSPRRLRSPPPPQMIRSPPASPRHCEAAVGFKELASRPGLTVTKSLPRAGAVCPALRHSRRGKMAMAHNSEDGHVRGAIDIVKGLEKKRQRRKEKFFQKYCNRARKGQIPERKQQPGMGYERMKELGLLMAGKIEQGNYVLSI